MTQFPPSEAVSLLVSVLFLLKYYTLITHGDSEGRKQIYRNVTEGQTGILSRITFHRWENLEDESEEIFVDTGTSLFIASFLWFLSRLMFYTSYMQLQFQEEDQTDSPAIYHLCEGTALLLA